MAESNYIDEFYNLMHSNINPEYLINELDPNIRKNRIYGTKKNQQAMVDLARLTSRYHQDISRINDAQSLEGAKRYIASRNLKNYQASDKEDIDGDGVNDITIRDARGNLVAVNGYTIKASDAPIRRQYYALDKQQRKEIGTYNDWKKNVYYQAEYDPATGQIIKYGRDPEYDAITVAMRKQKGFKNPAPKRLGAYRIFCNTLIKPVYDLVIEDANYKFISSRGNIQKINVYTPVCAQMWNEFIIQPAINVVIDSDPTGRIKNLINNPNGYNKLKANKEFKKLVTLITSGLINTCAKYPNYGNAPITLDILHSIINYANEWINNHSDKVFVDNCGIRQGRTLEHRVPKVIIDDKGYIRSANIEYSEIPKNIIKRNNKPSRLVKPVFGLPKNQWIVDEPDIEILPVDNTPTDTIKGRKTKQTTLDQYRVPNVTVPPPVEEIDDDEDAVPIEEV